MIACSNKSITNASDVILRGRGNTLHFNLHPNPSRNRTSYTIKLDEHHVTSPKNLTSFDIRLALSDVTSLQILASYCMNESVTFKRISLAHAVKKTGIVAEQVGFVENSTCPDNYTGLSCERCAVGKISNIPIDHLQYIFVLNNQ